MIQHIVMWKFREGTEAEQERFLEGLKGLCGQIPCIRALEVRRSAAPASEFDAVLLSEFDSLEDVEIYKKDPRHVAVAAICKAIRISRCAIDVEK